MMQNCALFAFAIQNGKLTPADILNGESMINVFSSDNEQDLHFKYDDKTKRLSVPKVDETDYEFKGDYTIIQL